MHAWRDLVLTDPSRPAVLAAFAAMAEGIAVDRFVRLPDACAARVVDEPTGFAHAAAVGRSWQRWQTDEDQYDTGAAMVGWATIGEAKRVRLVTAVDTQSTPTASRVWFRAVPEMPQWSGRTIDVLTTYGLYWVLVHPEFFSHHPLTFLPSADPSVHQSFGWWLGRRHMIRDAYWLTYLDVVSRVCRAP